MTENEQDGGGNGEVLGWLARTYEVHQEWIRKARDVFFNSNGDSELSRQRLATIVRTYFIDQKPAPEEVDRWAGLLPVKEKVVPPKVTPSNASYYDWLKVADYLLLPCASLDDEYLAENQRRESDYQQSLGSYTLRMQVNAAREAIRENPADDEVKILAIIQEKHAKASLANVKEAKRLEAKGEPLRNPTEPKRVSEMPRYKSLG